MVAAEWQSQQSSLSTQRGGHQIQTLSSRHIWTPVGQQDSQNDSQDTDLPFDCLQMSAARVFRISRFFHAERIWFTGGDQGTSLSLDWTVSPTLSRCLSLSLDRIELAQQETSDSKRADVEQRRNGSVGEGN